tara:strand:+ start:596 stop:2434 length:1839 start_codon:yes stop_codon:yes gene_type:complete
MGFLVSPGVEVKEIDLTNVIPAVSTSIGGFAGRFKWGPVGELITVSSENDLATVFGKPDAGTAQSFLTAASFLKYGNTLKISRVVNDVNAVGQTISASTSTVADSAANSPQGYLIKNHDDFDTQVSSIASQTVALSRCPGARGNSLRVITARASSFTISGSEDSPVQTAKTLLAANFDNSPTTANVTSGSRQDAVHVLVVDEDGEISGIKNNVLEKYQGLSLASDATNDDGSSNYYYDVINEQSQFIFINKLAGLYPGADQPVAEYDNEIDSPALSNTSNTGLSNGASDVLGGIFTGSFQFGADGTLAAGNYTSDTQGLGLFSDSETVDVNLLFTEAGQLDDSSQITVDQKTMSIASARKDVVAFLSAPVQGTTGVQFQTSEADKLSKVKTRKNNLGTLDSYHFIDSTPLYVYNKYSDNYVYIPAAGHMAGLCANTDNVADAWFSPAGLNRGGLRSVTKLAFNPNQASRDDLYKNNINPIVSFPGQGILLFGDKTGQSKASAFDRINVRRLFIVLEKAIATASKFQLFELNDEFTRAQFRNLVEPFLRDVKGRRGITDFLVVCDETNNTGQVIDTNRFVADIYIKPARSINFITLNFVATRTGVDFSEVVSG